MGKHHPAPADSDTNSDGDAFRVGQRVRFGVPSTERLALCFARRDVCVSPGIPQCDAVRFGSRHTVAEAKARRLNLGGPRSVVPRQKLTEDRALPPPGN